MGGRPAKGPEAPDTESCGPRVSARAWIEWDGEAFIGPGRAALLEGVERHGSITGAAQDVGVSYRTAWKWIGIMNRAASIPLVLAAPGGRGGGGASLTPAGRAALEAHRRLATGLEDFVARMNTELEGILDARSTRQRTCR